MARDLKVKVRLKADTKQATAAIGKFKSGFSSLTGAFAAFSIGAVAVALAIGRITAKVKEWIVAAQIQEDAVASLDAQLRKLGPSADSVSAALQKQASELQKVTRFGDETIISAQSQLAAFASTESGLKLLTIATLDFATAQGIELDGAAKLLAKTLGSTTNALIRYGIEVEGAAGSSERLESLTSNIATLFGGRAAAAAETYAGVMERLANAQGDVSESLGEQITQSETLLAAQLRLTENTETLSETLKGQTGVLGFLNVGWVNLQNQWVLTQNLIGTLTKKFFPLSEATKAAGNAAEEAGKKQAFAAEQARILAVAATALALEQDKAAAATTKLGAALGEATSVELQGQIQSITANLELTRQQLGANSNEFIRLEEIARIKLESLRARVLSLRDGLGDLKSSAEDAKLGFIDLGEGFDRAGEQADTFSLSTDRLRGSLDGAAGAAVRLTVATGGSVTARSSSSQGLVDAAVAGGAVPILGGTRIAVAGGGSRLLA